MRVLVLSALPVALPAGMTAISSSGARSHPPALVLLKGPASAQSLALAVEAQRRGARVVVLSPAPEVPEDLMPDERFEGPATETTERAFLAAQVSVAGGPGVPGPILIIDDERDIRESLAWLIDPCETRVAGSLDEARALLSSEPIRAVICDLQLSRDLGTDLLPWLATHRPALVDRFAVMTGGAMDQRAADAVQSSGVQVLEKPFTRAAVAALLWSLCGLDLDAPECDPGHR
jgi:CheY-like chemotaxis protein